MLVIILLLQAYCPVLPIRLNRKRKIKCERYNCLKSEIMT